MAQGMNKVQLIGNLGQKPELRFTTTGQSVLNLRLATNESWRNQNGEWQNRVEWHSVVVWGKRAEGLAKTLDKGDMVYVEGKLKTRSWEDKEGTRRYVTEVVVAGFNGEFIPLRRSSQQQMRDVPPPEDFDEMDSSSSGSPSASSSPSSSSSSSEFSDDDMPF